MAYAHRRSNSMEQPPRLDDLILLKQELILIYDDVYPLLKWRIRRLRQIINEFEADFRSATKGSIAGGVVGVAGGVTTIAGLALAPFTLGTSLVVTAAGSIVAMSGGISGVFLNIKKMYQQKKVRETIEAEIEQFEINIGPLTEIMKKITHLSQNILRDLDNLNHDGNFMGKWVAGVGEVRLIRVDDIREVSTQMSKTVRLTGTLTGVLARVGIVLDILSIIEDNKALDDMNLLARNTQINESEIKSKVGKFLLEMWKIIAQMDNNKGELKNTKDRIARLLNIT